MSPLPSSVKFVAHMLTQRLHQPLYCSYMLTAWVPATQVASKMHKAGLLDDNPLDDQQEVWPGATHTIAAAIYEYISYINISSCCDAIEVKQHPWAWE